MKTESLIKKYLTESSLDHLTQGKVWKLFRNSDWYKWAAQDIKECDEKRAQQNIEHYGQEFGQSIRHLNLI